MEELVLQTRLQDVEEKLAHKRRQLECLMLLTEAINSNENEETLCEKYLHFIEKELSVEQCAFAYAGDESWRFYANVDLNLDGFQQGSPSREIKSILSAFEKDNYEYFFTVNHKEKIIAIAAFGGWQKERYTESNKRFLKTITNFLAVAIENKALFRKQIQRERTEKELQVAHDMQLLLMPTIYPESKEVEFATKYIPHASIGGDYYDFFNLNQEKVLFCIADVAGKGIPAALMMANFQASLRRLTLNYKGLRILVEDLNAIVYKITKGEKFITFFIGEYDLYSDQLHYINAGHHAPRLVFKDGSIEELSEGTTVLGHIDPLPTFDEFSVHIRDECYILCCTDGLMELRDEEGQFFVEDQLNDLLVAQNYNDAESLNRLVETSFIDKAVNDHLRDDITVLICKINPEGIQRSKE